MKRALVALLLSACASAHAVERAPAALQMAVVASTASTTPTTAEPQALKLSIPAWDIFAGQEPSAEHAQGTLVVAASDERGQRLDELDIETMQVFRTVDFRADHFYALARSGDTLYVVTESWGLKSEPTHTIHRVDLGSLKITQSAPAVEAPPRGGWDYTSPPEVLVGSRGVRVVYRGRCPTSVPQSEEGPQVNCFYYETHRLGDLRVLKVHLRVYVMDFSKPQVEVEVPDDYGELPEAKRDDRAPLCATMSGGGGVWVGDNYFELRTACCTDPGGGLFQCKAPREK